MDGGTSDPTGTTVNPDTVVTGTAGYAQASITAGNAEGTIQVSATAEVGTPVLYLNGPTSGTVGSSGTFYIYAWDQAGAGGAGRRAASATRPRPTD